LLHLFVVDILHQYFFFNGVEKGHLRTKEKLGAFLRNFDGLEGIESQLKGKKKKEK
jgi:hypothetical protein